MTFWWLLIPIAMAIYATYGGLKHSIRAEVRHNDHNTRMDSIINGR